MDAIRCSRMKGLAGNLQKLKKTPSACEGGLDIGTGVRKRLSHWEVHTRGVSRLRAAVRGRTISVRAFLTRYQKKVEHRSLSLHSRWLAIRSYSMVQDLRKERGEEWRYYLPKLKKENNRVKRARFEQ